MSTTEALRALLAEATPGPWVGCGDCIEAASITHAGQDTIVATVEPDAEGLADVALIVTAVNALPALLDVAERADKVVRKPGANPFADDWERLRAALERLEGAS